MKAKDWILIGGLAVAAYLVYRLVSAVPRQAAATYNNAVDAVASGLYALFGPSDRILGSWRYYGVQFPDGTKHAIGDQLINQDGTFTWTGYPPGSQPSTVYQIIKDASGNYFAAAPGT